jgi:hypothetical protein
LLVLLVSGLSRVLDLARVARSVSKLVLVQQVLDPLAQAPDWSQAALLALGWSLTAALRAHSVVLLV